MVYAQRHNPVDEKEQDKWDVCATVDALPVELPALHGDPVLGDCHAQILHRQHSPALARTARASASEPGTLDAEVRIAFAALCALAAGDTARRGACAGGTPEAGGGSQTAHGVVGGGAVGGADARELVGVGGDVGDELLGCEGEEAGEVRRGLVGACTWWRQAGEGEVVGRDGVRDLGGS